MAKYKLQDNRISPITYVYFKESIDGETLVGSNFSDEQLDNLKSTNMLAEINGVKIIPKTLISNDPIPTYDSETQYLRLTYTEDENNIYAHYEVLDIIPSETEVLQSQITNNEVEISCLSDILIEVTTM